MSYKHGIYTENVATSGSLAIKANGTVPVYIGTAKISTTDDVNKPILINSYSDFVAKVGYDENWDSYTLSEVGYAHFQNNIQAIAPFVVIKMGSGDTAFADALAAVDKVPVVCGVTPNIIVAPKYSEDTKNATAMVSKCTEKIDGKWSCIAYIDIPTDSADTIAKATAYKTTAKITSKLARLHYPKAKFGGRVYHLSVLDAVITQIVDNGTDGVSCRSSSNKVIPCDVPVLDKDTNAIYSESEANSLNEKGITTINYIGGSYRLWGGHMANYDYSSISSINPQDMSDATVRMQSYLDNWLKIGFIDVIDAPLTRREIDNLLSSVSIWLNSLVNSGYLLKGECYFDGGDNATAELADGNLVLDVLHTETPNGKAINFKLQYDVSGLDALYAVKEV